MSTRNYQVGSIALASRKNRLGALPHDVLRSHASPSRIVRAHLFAHGAELSKSQSPRSLRMVRHKEGKFGNRGSHQDAATANTALCLIDRLFRSREVDGLGPNSS